MTGQIGEKQRSVSSGLYSAHPYQWFHLQWNQHVTVKSQPSSHSEAVLSHATNIFIISTQALALFCSSVNSVRRLVLDVTTFCSPDGNTRKLWCWLSQSQWRSERDTTRKHARCGTVGFIRNSRDASKYTPTLILPIPVTGNRLDFSFPQQSCHSVL